MIEMDGAYNFLPLISVFILHNHDSLVDQLI